MSRDEIGVLCAESLLDMKSTSELLDDALEIDEESVDEWEKLNLSDSNFSLVNYSTSEKIRLLETSLCGSREWSNLSRALF